MVKAVDIQKQNGNIVLFLKKFDDKGIKVTDFAYDKSVIIADTQPTTIQAAVNAYAAEIAPLGIDLTAFKA